jgi:hypothetical protein
MIVQVKTISNKTHRPLSVPLPRGKVLHLGPGRTGQIASEAAEHPPLKRLVEAGEIEILGEGHVGPAAGGAAGKVTRSEVHGHTPAPGGRRSGDR